MKSRNSTIFVLIIAVLVSIGLGIIYVYNKNVSNQNLIKEDVKKEDSSKEDQSKEEILKKFYSSYEKKSTEIFNESVVDSLKIKTDEEKERRSLLYDDLKSFKLLDLTENKESAVKTIDDTTYDKENIAEFTVNYEIDFDKNIYGTAGEGKQSVRKIIVRKDKNSPWLVAGQIDGQGY